MRLFHNRVCEGKLPPWGKMGIALFQVPTSFDPYFYARSIVSMVSRRLTKNHSSDGEFNREVVIFFYPRGTHFTPTETTN